MRRELVKSSSSVCIHPYLGLRVEILKIKKTEKWSKCSVFAEKHFLRDYVQEKSAKWELFTDVLALYRKGATKTRKSLFYFWSAMQQPDIREDRYGEKLPFMSPLDKRHKWQLGQNVSPGVLLYPWHRAICKVCGLKVLYEGDPLLGGEGYDHTINVNGIGWAKMDQLYFLYPGAHFVGHPQEGRYFERHMQQVGL